MKIFISILIAIYILWSVISLVSLGFLDTYPDEPKCFKITNYINFGILCLVAIGVVIGLFATIIYVVIF